MDEERKRKKSKQVLAIILIVLAMTFAIVTSIILNSINKKYDDLNDKNQNLPQVESQILD